MKWTWDFWRYRRALEFYNRDCGAGLVLRGFAIGPFSWVWMPWKPFQKEHCQDRSDAGTV